MTPVVGEQIRIMKSSRTVFIQVVIFSIAMGYLEAAVVIYLREIYYPEGFSFPLKLLSQRDIFVELARECATLVMLIILSVIAGKTKAQRFAFFLLAFGVWDLCYYVFLWLLLHWPQGLLTWDILFLLPVMWVGPILAPCILSVTMIGCAEIILRKERSGGVKFTMPVLICLIGGSLLIITSFCEDPIRSLSAGNRDALYVPTSYLWWLFISGELVILGGIYQLMHSKTG